MTNDVAKIAAGLTDQQRARLRTFAQEPRQMGIGLMSYLPGCIAPDDFDHPCFGPHYRLTETGEAVRKHLEDRS